MDLIIANKENVQLSSSTSDAGQLRRAESDITDMRRSKMRLHRRPSVGLLAEVLGDYARHDEETAINRHRYEQAMLNVFGSKAVIPPQCEHTGPTVAFPTLCSEHLSNPHFAFYMGIAAK